MTRLLLLNGPPGIGKSTLARRYVADHPLALCLDPDSIRRQLGSWDTHPDESGRLTRLMVLEMARVHLSSGHDVVVPQYLGRREFPCQLSDLAVQLGVRYDEIVLMADLAEVVRRFWARADDPELARHHAEVLTQLDPDVDLGRIHAELSGSTALAVQSTDLEQTYADVLSVLSSRSPTS